MASLIKVLAAETDLTSATNVSSATVVRLHNTGSATVVTRKNSGGDTLGSFTIGANESVLTEKDPSDTLEGGAGIKAAKIAYTS